MNMEMTKCVLFFSILVDPAFVGCYLENKGAQSWTAPVELNTILNGHGHFVKACREYCKLQTHPIAGNDCTLL